MANTYTARIRAKLDSADLQEQIDAIAKSAKEIKINLNVDGDVQKLFEQINSKMSSTSKAATITPKVDTKQAENQLDVLQKRIISLGEDGKNSVKEISKAMGDSFDTITTTVEGIPKTITQDYAAAAKRIEAENKKIAELESQINAEISKTKSLLNDMNTESSMRYQLEQRLNSIQSEGTSKEKLEQAKALTAETKDWLAVSEKVLEAEQKITKEQREQEKKQSSAINKNQESEYKKTIDLESKINDEISKTKNLLNEMNSESSMRYQLEKRLSELESQDTSQGKLDEAKALTAETKDWLTVSQRVLETQQKITQEQRAQEQKQSSAMNKNQESLYRSINSELEKSSNYINKMVEGTSERLTLEKQLNELSKAGVSEENLQRAKKLTNEAKEKYQIEKNELATQQKIKNEIKQIEARMEGVKMSSSQRLEIEKKIEDAMAMQNSQDKLNALKNVNTEITAMGKNAMGLGAMLQTAYEKFAIWSVATVSWYGVVHAVQDMIDNVIELDTSLTELRKVTDLSGEALDNFTEKAYDMSTELARTGQEVVDATTEFAKAGYNLQESMALAEDALLWKNISDGMVEVSDASNMIIANLKAFDKQGISSRHIIDSLNEVA